MRRWRSRLRLWPATPGISSTREPVRDPPCVTQVTAPRFTSLTLVGENSDSGISSSLSMDLGAEKG
jgi:hypothetical protein